jgi:hypothetical protein
MVLFIFSHFQGYESPETCPKLFKMAVVSHRFPDTVCPFLAETRKVGDEIGIEVFLRGNGLFLALFKLFWPFRWPD